MKRIYQLLFCLPLFFAVQACNDDLKGLEDELTPPPTTIEDAVLELFSSDDNVLIGEDQLSAEVILAPLGGSAAISVETDQEEWELLPDVDDQWCEVKREGDQVYISATEFRSEYTRMTMIRIVAGNAVAEINVSQDGTERAQMSVTPNELNFTEEGGSATVEVDTNREDWWVYGQEDLNWIEVIKGENSFEVTVPRNSVPEDLYVRLNVRAGADEVNYRIDTVLVTLAAWNPAFINLSTKEVIVPQEGGEATITVGTNREWNAVSNNPWISVENDFDERIIHVTVDPKAEGIIEGSVTVTAGEGSDMATETILVYYNSRPMIWEITLEDGDKMIFNATGNYNVYIEWGDGATGNYAGINPTSTSATYPEHIYERGGTYEMKIYGETDQIWWNTGGWLNEQRYHLRKVLQWGDLGLISGENAFYGCTNLEYIAEGMGDFFWNTTTLANLFTNCKSLTQIPSNSFAGCEHVTNIGSMFNGSGIKNIPQGLFDPLVSVTGVASLFSGCSDLESVPADMLQNKGAITNITSMFLNCISLKEIPSGLFDNLTDVTGMTSVFIGCTSITSIPTGLFKDITKVSGFMCSSVFEGCTNLSAIPVDLFSSFAVANNITNTFEGCTSITEIPAGLLDNCPALASVSGMFSGTSITAIPQGIFDNNPLITNISETFSGTAITRIPDGLLDNQPNLTNVNAAFSYCMLLESIPASLFDNNRKITNFRQTFNNCIKVTGPSPYTTISVEGVNVNVHLYERSAYPDEFTSPSWYNACFFGCEDLTDFSAIPTNWVN